MKLLFLIFHLILLQIVIQNIQSIRVSNDPSKLSILQSLIQRNNKLSGEIEKLKNKDKNDLSFKQINPSQGILSPPSGNGNGLTPCIEKEGMLKIRDKDVVEREVAVCYAYLNNERLTYYINPKDETSIQGSIELKKIKGDIEYINNFPTCFSIKTIDDSSDCSICAENETKANEWIKAITQNSVNCVN